MMRSSSRHPAPKGDAPVPAPRSSSSLASAPGDGRPDALVNIIPDDFGCDLEGCDRSRYFNPARHEPADRKCIERSQGPPTDGLEDRSCVFLLFAQGYYPGCLLL